MIAVDASAIVAILTSEPDGAELSARIGAQGSGSRVASTVTIWEASCAIARQKGLSRREGLSLVEEYLALVDIRAVAPDHRITALAVDAAERYGRGIGYPGILNLSDCFSYATAKHLGASLLFKGDDFARTDITPA